MFQSIKYSHIKILTGSDLSRRRLPLMTIQSVNPGPVVWLTGCMHGDEVIGMVVIQEIFKILKKQPLLKGSIYAFPLMNPIGFETGSRNITLSKEDLNRAFPGSKLGSLAERIADRIFCTIVQTRPSVVIDIHNDWQNSIPYVAIDPDPGPAHRDVYDQTRWFAQQTGFLVVRDTDEIQHTLSDSLIHFGVPALTIELGESYVINEINVGYGVRSIQSLLAGLGMMADNSEPFYHPNAREFAGKILTYSQQPTSSSSGIIRFLIKPGDRIRKDQPFARIYNPFGKVQETLLARRDGIVLGHSDSAVAFPGVGVTAFGEIEG
jgi:predicted deacylase